MADGKMPEFESLLPGIKFGAWDGRDVKKRQVYRRLSWFQIQPSLLYIIPIYRGKAPVIYLAQPNGLG